MAARQWMNLHVRDNWGNLTLMCGKQAVTVKSGRIRVKFPNGRTASAWVRQYPYSETIHDMGHSYEVSGSVAGLTVLHEGIEVRMPWESVAVDAARVEEVKR